MSDELMLNIVSDFNNEPRKVHERLHRKRRERVLQRKSLQARKQLELRRLFVKNNNLGWGNSADPLPTGKNPVNLENRKEIPQNIEKKETPKNGEKKDTPNIFEKKNTIKNVGKSQVNIKRTSFQKPRHSLFGGNPTIPKLDCPVAESKGEDAPFETTNAFSNLNVYAGLKNFVINKMKFECMTEVQSKALPVLLSNKDALISAETGSGKTLAYALALLQGMYSMHPPITRADGLMALVLVPTRELALQTYEVFRELTQPMVRIVATCIIGGQKRKSEKSRLRKGINLIISTPGRFIDHLENTSCLSLKNLRWLVFDEADRILDMGFQTAINSILSSIKKSSKVKQQVILLSATLTTGVEKLVELSLDDPVRIEVKQDQKMLDNAPQPFVDPLTGLMLEKVSLPDKLKQHVMLVPSKLRLVTLLAFINTHCTRGKEDKLLVFVSCRDSVAFHQDLIKKFDMLDYNVNQEEIMAYQLHGGMSLEERVKTIQQFKKCNSGVIFCTDVAARGLDIPNLDWVIQYTSPGSPVDYIHRVGRTARAGHEGNSLLFLTPAEAPYLELLLSYGISINEMEVDNVLAEVIDDSRQKLQHNIRLQVSKETASLVHRKLEQAINDDKSLKESAAKAFMASVRAYSTYPHSLKHIFHIKNLHMGHVTESFGLQNAPTDVVSEFHKMEGQKLFRLEKNASKKSSYEKSDDLKKFLKPAKAKGKKRHPLVAHFDLMSEFSSGTKKRKSQ